MCVALLSALCVFLLLVLCCAAVVLPALAASLFALWVLEMTWFLFFTDRDAKLAFAERFGWGVNRLEDKVVWVTGATSAFGESLTYELAKAGAKIIVTAKNKKRLQNIRRGCIEVTGGRFSEDDILLLPFELEKMREKDVDAAVQHFGKIDVLVSNVGMLELGGSCETPVEVDQDLFQSNFFGFVNLSRMVLRQFLDQGGGHFLVVSSITSGLGIPGRAAYCATKHAQKGYFEALRSEHERDNIFVTVVSSGFHKFTRPVLTGGKQPRIANEVVEVFDRDAIDTRRTAYLTLVATANRLQECMIAKQPYLLWASTARLFPDTHTRIMLRVFTKERLEQIYEGKWPRITSWKSFFNI